MNSKEEVSRWQATRAQGFLARVGVRQGHVVLDFGCNKGSYSQPAARLVGPTGRVYALDKSGEALEEAARTARENGLRNIEFLHVDEGRRIPLASDSIDIALLYDVYHRGYSPEAEQRQEVLRRVHRVLRHGGFLSLYPTHLRQYGMTMGRVVQEVADAGFWLRQVSRRCLVHDNKLVRGRVLSFVAQ
jgi:ubiquinone/menaquinone biosynthesis C-methylase UbiE